MPKFNYKCYANVSYPLTFFSFFLYISVSASKWRIRGGSSPNQRGGQSVALTMPFHNWLDYMIFQSAWEWHSLCTFNLITEKVGMLIYIRRWSLWNVSVECLFSPNMEPNWRCIYKMSNYSVRRQTLASNEKGHCELALTLYLWDLICFSLFESHRIPWQMGFGRGRGGVELALLGKVHISKQNTLISPILFLQTMPPSPWTTAKDGIKVRRGKLLAAKSLL